VAVFLLGILAVILYWMIDRLERVLLKGVAGKATEGS
jgi:ABC-type nitrate/sulfonate/bicarbonate transport system permease component